jgi:hypothetical protein
MKFSPEPTFGILVILEKYGDKIRSIYTDKNKSLLL